MKSTTQATINELIAGSVGGAAQVLVGQPLDTIKTRAQIAPSSVLYAVHETAGPNLISGVNRGHVCKSSRICFYKQTAHLDRKDLWISLHRL
jgi:hypothetical protein